MGKKTNNLLSEMSTMELEGINGGNGIDALLVGAGTVSVAWAVPVALAAACTPVGIAMFALGGAAVLVGCGVDFEFIEY